MLGDIRVAKDIYIACGYTDMRKSIDGLAALVSEHFQMDPFAPALYIFCGRRCDRIKALLEEARGSRHVFVIVHAPAFPFDSPDYWYWYLLGNKKDSRAEQRRDDYAARLDERAALAALPQAPYR